MDDCDQSHDPPGTFYGFTEAEWAAAGARSGGSAAKIAEKFAQTLRIIEGGGLVAMDFETVLAVARLGPDYARRWIARLEPALTRDVAAAQIAIARDESIPPEHEAIIGFARELRQLAAGEHAV
jgi:hypothetical protein